MHRRAMILLRQTQSQHVTDYSPIAKSLTTLDIATEPKIRRKFDVAYFIAKQNLSLASMPPLCDLEERHGLTWKGTTDTTKLVPRLSNTSPHLYVKT